MTSEVRKAIMIRSNLRNKFLKDKNEQLRNYCRKQFPCRNLCDVFVHRAKQQYFSTLDLSLIANNKHFGKQSNHSFQTRFLI